ncbi:MAG: carbohydrate ABC transporter permease [Petrotogales bacterium]
MTKNHLSWYKAWHAWIFLIPTLIGLFVFRLGPIIFAMFMSFTRWNILTSPKWIGLTNYKELFSDPVFGEILMNTIIFSTIYVSGVMVFGLSLAVLVNTRVKGISFFRASYFVPVVTSAVAIGIIWNWILSPKYGLVNNLLDSYFNVTGPSWLGSKNLALIVVSLVQVWKMMGYYMILFLAGLQSIPRVYYEAATIDGASRRKKFWKITLPLLSPTTFFVLIISIIDSFRNFEIIYTMTQGGPSNATNTLVYSVYVNGFVFYRMGYASAIAYILLAFVGAITILNFMAKKYWVKYQY